MIAIIKQRPIFCTLFNTMDGHITKDVGLIPYGMHKFLGYDSFIATHINEEYPSMKYVPGLRIEEVPKRSGKWLIDSLLWLRKNAKKIDILNIYHIGGLSLFNTIIYRLFNPKGRIYFKFDGSPLPNEFNIVKRLLHSWTIKHCNLVSTELSENAGILREQWHSENIKCVADPLNPSEIQDYRPFSERTNTILTVGRLGSKQKATEILLEAFAKIADKIPDWNLKLVGSFSENLNIANEFFAEYPDMKERVIFAGAIREREMISEVYRNSKIFAFPSRWESFGIALTEAMMNGCFAVCSRIPSSVSLTENFKYAYGHDVDDVDALAEKLLYACTHESEIEALALEGRNATLRRCDLKSVCEAIAEGLR